MSNDSKKLLTLGNVEAIKDYIDTISGNMKYYIDENVKDELNNKIEQAEKTLEKKFTDKSSELMNKISELEQSQGNKEEIDELKLELDALNANHANMNSALDTLKQEMQDVNSIFSSGQINEIIKTALITEVDIQPDKILTPEMLATKIVALIGNFGQINATNIIGSEIFGKTIKSIDDKWLLNNNGSGVLANGNISWDENGNVVFGPDVKLNWGNISDAPNVPDGGLTEEQVDEKIATEISKYEVRAEQLTGQTITGATIKSSDDKWELNSTGAGYLGNFDGVKAIEWNTDGVTIQGTNVEIAGDVKINGQAILDGVKSDESIQTQFAELTAEKISADSIIGNEIVGKTVKSSDDKWELNRDGSGHLGKFGDTKSIEWNTDGVTIQGTNVEIAGDVKINGAAIITGITENESAQQSFNTMVADCIDATEIKTEVLETKPDDNKDKIHIEDNYIYCIDNDSKRNLKISSDDINMNCLDALFTPISKNNGNIYNKVTSWTALGGNGTYGGVYYINTTNVTSGQGTTNVASDETIDTINAGGKCTPIGYLFANTNISITLNVALCYDKGPQFTVNRYEYTGGLYWNIVKGDTLGWGHTQAGTSNSSTGGYLLVYKLNNETGIYEPYKQYPLSGEWRTISDASIGGTTTNNSGYYKVKDVNDINIDSDGMYGVEIVFETNSIKYEKKVQPTAMPQNMYINARFVIKTDSELPDQYTEIGKNGLISFNKDTAISLDNNGAILKSKILADDGAYNFYGIKVTTDGIYLGGGTTEWNKLDIPKLLELLSTTTTNE